MTRFSLFLLSSFQATLDGEPVAGLSTDKARALLAYLALEADRPHRRDALAGLLWPDQPQRKARHSLRQALSHLRQALDDQDEALLLVTREAVQFNPRSDHWLDVAAFTALIATSQSHRHRRLLLCRSCIRCLQEAVELYRGSFLECFSVGDSPLFEDWASLKREWFHRQAVEALSHLSNFHQRRSEYEQACQYIRRHVTLEPWREEAHRQLMHLLAVEGQRSAALTQYETCRRALNKELGVEPTAGTTALYERIRVGDNLETWQGGGEIGLPSSNLPTPSTLFVGREEELIELADMLANPDCHLITLVGPGGIGKTRLAIQAAMEQVGGFDHGVHFISLASVGTTDAILPEIAGVLGFSFRDRQDPTAQLLNYLRGKEMLLVLDNMEHLLDGSPLLAEILHRAPGVVCLVTSRERLNLREEWVHKVEGLTYPQDLATQNPQTYSAIQLFRQHARRRDGTFALKEAEMPAVLRICQLVEGMPLGVELAAAWVAARPCGEIAQEIAHNLDILGTHLYNGPQRHRSVRAAFEHSWQLLDEREKALCARLSVFRGGFRREAAVEVAGASPLVLLALLDKSLIRRVSPDRYEMHGMLRQYAAEKLATDPEAYEQAQARHIHYFVAFLKEREDLLKGAAQRQALQEIAVEIENARQAWRQAVSRGDDRQIEQSLPGLYHFYNVRGRFQEGINLFALAIEAWGQYPQRADVVSKVLCRQGALYRRLGRYEQARSALEKSLETFKCLGARTECIFCLVSLASVFQMQGDYQAVKGSAQESLTLSRQAGDSWGIARSLFLLGMVHLRTGDVEQAETLFGESLDISRQIGNPRFVMFPLNALGDIACHRGNYTQARDIFEECLALSRELDDLFNVAQHLNNLGTVLHLMEAFQAAQRYYRESLEICREIGDQNGQAIAFSNLGELAHQVGDYAQALAFYREGLSIGRTLENQRTIVICLNNLGQTACALKDWEAAQTYLIEALGIASKTQEMAALLQVLVNLSVLFARRGQPDRAVTLLVLARHHPATEQGVQERAQHLLDQLGLDPSDGDPASLDSIVAEILDEM